jgi:hypothetical protein
MALKAKSTKEGRIQTVKRRRRKENRNNDPSMGFVPAVSQWPGDARLARTHAGSRIGGRGGGGGGGEGGGG